MCGAKCFALQYVAMIGEFRQCWNGRKSIVWYSDANSHHQVSESNITYSRFVDVRYGDAATWARSSCVKHPLDENSMGGVPGVIESGSGA